MQKIRTNVEKNYVAPAPLAYKQYSQKFKKNLMCNFAVPAQQYQKNFHIN
jgi:hypothetical protein